MFIAREKELSILNHLIESNKFEFLVMYGRRRVGKSELLNQIAKEYKTLFYVAQSKNDKMNLDSFSKTVFNYFNLGNGLNFAGWKEAFEFIGDNYKEKLILIIDEFPFMATENPTVMSILQHLIDYDWIHKNIKIILCGSSISFMEKEVLSSKSPLYGRRTASLEVKPFDYYDASLFFPKLDNETKACIYGVYGGIPAYLSQYNENKSFKQNVMDNFFKEASFLSDEPSFLLRTELREISMYNSILEAIATGNAKISEISNEIQEENTKTSKYLKVLNQLRITERIVPATENINKSKKSLYLIKDNLFHFWYQFVFAHKQEIELFGEENAYKYVEKHLSEYMGHIFEEMCNDYLIKMIRNNQIDFIPQSVGKWWGTNIYRLDKNGKPVQDDIDILMCNKDTCLLGECKYKNELFKYSDYVLLQERAKLLKQSNKIFYCFAKTGFENKLIEEEKNVQNLHLVTLNDLYNL